MMKETAWLSKGQRSDVTLTPSQTAVRKDIHVPAGHVAVSDKWRGSQLTETLAGQTNLRYENYLGIVDFHLPDNLVVLYITEADLVAGNSYKQKLAKLKSSKTDHCVILVEVTTLSEQYFQDVQKFVVFSLKLKIISVSSQKDAAALLSHMVMSSSHQSTNQFLVKRRHPPMEVVTAKALQSIPHLGPKKVQALMHKYSDLTSLSSASKDDLLSVLGQADAQNVFKFFNEGGLINNK